MKSISLDVDNDEAIALPLLSTLTSALDDDKLVESVELLATPSNNECVHAKLIVVLVKPVTWTSSAGAGMLSVPEI